MSLPIFLGIVDGDNSILELGLIGRSALNLPMRYFK